MSVISVFKELRVHWRRQARNAFGIPNYTLLRVTSLPRLGLGLVLSPRFYDNRQGPLPPTFERMSKWYFFNNQISVLRQ